MISKVITGKTFYGTCRYVCMDQERATVLETEGVRGHDFKLMAADFAMQQSLRPSLTNAVFHGILSFYPGEEITDEKMVQIAKEYLHEIGIVDTQYSITKHIDRDHPHLHVIANLVNNQGKTIKDNWIGLRGKKVAQNLTLKHGLTQALSKNLVLTNLERLSEKEANRYVIYQAISETLPLCKNLAELKHQLEKQGIETLYKYKGHTQERQGISFKIGEYKYKGSVIDRNFSLRNLQRTLQEQQIKQHLNQSFKNSPEKKSSQREDVTSSKDVKMAALNIMKEIMKPERNFEKMPYQFKKKRNKKKSQRLHL